MIRWLINGGNYMSLLKQVHNNFLGYPLHYIIIVFSFLVTSSLFAYQPTYSMNDSNGVPLDKKLVQLMNFRGGTFIEVGAFDGATHSNTKLFEESYGWTGILVEPSAILFPRLQLNRPGSKCFQCALGSFEENGTYKYGDFDGHMMSSLTGRINRPATKRVLMRSLQSILDECGLWHINLMSLDTEGYELNILKGIDFNKVTFDYMLIEVYSSQYDQIIQFLSDKGYDMVENFSHYNKKDNPNWDGSHNDYLFIRRDYPSA